MNLALATDTLHSPPKPADSEKCERGLDRWRDLSRFTDDEELQAFIAACAEDGTPERRLLEAIFGNSPHLSQSLLRDPATFRAYVTEGPEAAFAAVLSEVSRAVSDETDTAKAMKALRVAKRRGGLVIALADIADRWPLERVTGALTALADTTLRLTVAFLLRDAERRGEFALPHPDQPERTSGFFVLGMGKYGAGELNYSSDIDLIVLYDDEKIAYTGRKSLRECFIRLTKDLVRMMDERTGDGYVFRTDLRLRPDPGSTPPALSVGAAETYYESFGQNWERAAMIKARCVAGDLDAGDVFLRYLRPFVWRKSLDFYALRDVQSIKRQIYAHKGGGTIAVAGHNIKLGRGGIREVEFFAQTQQLIWGGREPTLRTNRTVEALRALVAFGQVKPQTAEQLIEAYAYLRRLEHRLQMIDDHQTQTLPDSDDRLHHLAVFLGYDGQADFAEALVTRLKAVERHYADLFEDEPSLSEEGNLVFTGGDEDPETLATIGGYGFVNAKAVSDAIRGWHHARYRCTRSTRSREYLTELTPTLLKALGKTPHPDQAFLRFDEFLSKLPAGVQLFSMFSRNPQLLELLAEIMGGAPRLAEHLARNPSLLDHVLSSGFYEPLEPLAELCADLKRRLDTAESFEDVLDLTRRWTHDRQFQVGVQMLRASVTMEQASASLTDIAEAALGHLIPHVIEDFARTHGHIPGAEMAVLAMGKMGGREMTPTSDLDLILIYDHPADCEGSDGDKPLGPGVYFIKLTQRVVNAITALTNEGRLYEVDMRLRPSGNKGPLAASLGSFVKYHEEAAWTWERLALTRARVIFGPPPLAARIDGVVRDTLMRVRDHEQLLLDVDDMRARMARDRKADGPWDIKNIRGGLVDIEFLVQYLELRHGPDRPGLFRQNTADALVALGEAGLLTDGPLETLTEALHLWTALQGVLRLSITGRFDPETAPQGLKDTLAAAVGAPDFDHLTRLVEETAGRVHAVYRDVIEAPAEALRADRRNEDNEE